METHPDGRETPYVTASVLAPIRQVNIETLDGDPPQYQARIVFDVPLDCSAYEGYRVERDGDTVRVILTNREEAPVGMACGPAPKTQEQRVWLGSDFDPGETYMVEVNGVGARFTAR